MYVNQNFDKIDFIINDKEISYLIINSDLTREDKSFLTICNEKTINIHNLCLVMNKEHYFMSFLSIWHNYWKNSVSVVLHGYIDNKLLVLRGKGKFLSLYSNRFRDINENITSYTLLALEVTDYTIKVKKE